LADGLGREERAEAEANALELVRDARLPVAPREPAEQPAAEPRKRSAFLLLDPHALKAEAVLGRGAPKRPVLFAVGALFLVALLVVAFGRSLWLRTLLPFALALVAGAVWWRSRRAPKPVEAPPVATTIDEVPVGERALVLTDDSVDLERNRGERISHPISLTLVGREGSQRFGVTLLSNAKRDRLVAVLTSETGSMLFATNIDGDGARPGIASLLSRSTVVGGHDHALDAVAPDGAPTELAPDAFVRLLSELSRRDAACFDRIILSDQHGAPLLLEGSDLYANDHHFDLSRPLEWRSILFQESFGSAVTLYQGTWVRQNGAEVVLVSLLGPSFFEPQASASPADARTSDRDPELDVHAMRDQRLSQATATDPPPTDQRVAIDGIFVLPVRAALDQAPRQSTRQPRVGLP
jgi:hypothetical protein